MIGSWDLGNPDVGGLLTSACLQSYGKELAEAFEWLQKYQTSRKEAELHQAWDLYYHVFKRINKQLPQLTTLDLHYVSPALASAEVRLHPRGTPSSSPSTQLTHSFLPRCNLPKLNLDPYLEGSSSSNVPFLSLQLG